MNKVYFSNKTVADIILKDEFTKMPGKNFTNTITYENVPGYDHRHIDKAYLKDMTHNFNQHFYICSPLP